MRAMLMFVVAGALNTAAGYLVYLTGLIVGLGPAVALAIATVFGALFNYATTSRLVFRERGLHVLPRFLCAYAGLYLLNFGILRAAIAFGFSAWLGQALTLPIVVVASYVILTFWVFGAKLTA
jgi:putative flippase GtrA